jgi:hypothetical protein
MTPADPLDPDLDPALAAIRDVFGKGAEALSVEPNQPAQPITPPHLPPGWDWRDKWQDEPVGRCWRCPWDANTRGPDGRAVHAYCWGSPDTSVPADDYEAHRRWQREQHRRKR